MYMRKMREIEEKYGGTYHLLAGSQRASCGKPESQRVYLLSESVILFFSAATPILQVGDISRLPGTVVALL